jgi:LysM repeat protein
MMSCAKRVAFLALVLGCAGLSGCLPPVQSVADEEREPHFLEGRSRVNSMDYDGAIQSFENALIANPKSASAHFELGWLYDQRKREPATAIYHYGRFLDVHASGEKAGRARLRITACKQELARTVSLAPVAQNLQHEFDELTEQNRRLREENDRWRAFFVRLQGQSNAPAPTLSETPTPVAPARNAESVSGRRSERASLQSGVPRGTNELAFIAAGAGTRTTSFSHSVASRTHTVKSGETPSAIARKYSIRLENLIAANPRLDARRMQIGQTLNIPGN